MLGIDELRTRRESIRKEQDSLARTEDRKQSNDAGTLAEARGLGAYRATIAKRLETAWEHGARFGLVHARVNTSLPILARMGFVSYGEARLYSLRA